MLPDTGVEMNKPRKSGIPILARTVTSSGGRLSIGLTTPDIRESDSHQVSAMASDIPYVELKSELSTPRSVIASPECASMHKPRSEPQPPAASTELTVPASSEIKIVPIDAVTSEDRIHTIGLLTPPPRTPPLKEFTEAELEDLYDWVDQIPFSCKGKNNIHRDFSDAVRLAELIHHFMPKIISLHNYSHASGRRAKIDNWETLNNKVLKKIGLPPLNGNDIYDLASGKAGSIEVVLAAVREAITWHQQHANIGADDAQSVDNNVPRQGGVFRLDSQGGLVNMGQSRSRAVSGGGGPELPWSAGGESEWTPSLNPVICDYYNRRVAERTPQQRERTRDRGSDHDGRKNVFEDTCTVHALYENKSRNEVAKIVDYVLYEGCKMIPEPVVNAFQDQLRISDEQIKNMGVKIRRLETLVTLKESRLQDLTQDLHELKLEVEDYRRTKSQKPKPNSKHP